ncbi:hypothetical protein AAFC00_003687 [Neodothiora populina]|uniref:Uncharacterized protein n=1 Tax=Neodothiora populina TaxID=2781224 RepID=A0ABR3PG79_9PEZI
MATTRLRKTFHYPSSDDDEPDLDTQDQEELITSLTLRDARQNDFYRRAFLPLPLASLLLYVPAVIIPRAYRDWLIAVLSITSLVGTAYILFLLPLRFDDDADGSNLSARKRGKRPAYKGDPRGPAERFIVLLNALLCLVLGLVAVVAWRRGSVEGFWRGVLPGAIFSVILFARSQMTAVDVVELERLKYNYKGA